MDTGGDSGPKSSRGRTLRPVRNRRFNRRIFDEDRRPTKRLFTPEIKKYLKDWLIRRRDNPYPSRDEKKTLAHKTGLTYIQICNWFANWRRKLKNAGREPQRKTWSHLIKTYNRQAHGNVEHFSICSDDSIWEEFETPTQAAIQNSHTTVASLDHCYTTVVQYNNEEKGVRAQCSQITSSDIDDSQMSFTNNNKYKNHIMEKYLRDIDHLNINDDKQNDCETNAPMMLTKWLESTAKFKPRQKNYIEWCENNSRMHGSKKKNSLSNNDLRTGHLRDELDAAEALTKLANSNLTNCCS